jgi:hypothetical protein
MDAVLGTSSILWHVHGIINIIKHCFVNHPSWLGSWVSRKANGAPMPWQAGPLNLVAGIL